MHRENRPTLLYLPAIRRNIGLLGMIAAYILLLFYPEAISNAHARVIICQFVVFILPGFILYKLVFIKKDQDIYEKLSLSFILSCFVFAATGGIAYFLRLPLLFYMRGLLLLFIIGAVILFYRNQDSSAGPIKINKINKTNLFNISLLLIVALYVYFITARGATIGTDAFLHLANMVKIADSGIITPDGVFSKGLGPHPGYFYNPHHLILAVIKKLSGAGQYVVWHYLPMLLLVFIPVCYYSLVKAAFNDKRIAYFAFFFIIGLYFTEYYWFTINFPYPRRFLKELLIPTFYIPAIQYFRHSQKKDLLLLVMSSMVIVMYHSMGMPFMLFNCLLYVLFLFVFKDGLKNFKKHFIALLGILLANLSYGIGCLLNVSLVSALKKIPDYHVQLHISQLTPSIFMINSKPFFSTDSGFGYLVLLILILTQSNSALTFIMLTILMVGPVFLYFPPFAMLFSKLFSVLLMGRVREVTVIPLFYICFLVFLSFYGIKYLQRLRKKTDKLYWLGIISLIGLNTYFIKIYFWVTQVYVARDTLVSIKIWGVSSKIILVIMVIMSLSLFLFFNRKKMFASEKPFTLNSGPHLLAVLFVPLILNTIYRIPKIIEQSKVTQQVNYTNRGGYSLNGDYIPKLLEYISSREKPRSVVVITKDQEERWQISQFIPQFTLYFGRTNILKVSDAERQRKEEALENIYDENVSMDKTLNLIYENEINYIIAHGEQHKKFENGKNNFKLACLDLTQYEKKIYLYKVLLN